MTEHASKTRGPDRVLHLDCFSGVAGNMMLGSLLELGASADKVQEDLDGLGVEGLRLRATPVRRGAIAAMYVAFQGPERDSRERRYDSIRGLIGDSPLPEVGNGRCRSLISIADS